MKSESKKVFTALITLSVITLIAIGLMITFIYKNYKRASDLKQQSVDELAKVADLTSLKQIVGDTTLSREYLESLFVDKERVIDFLGFIESLGNLSNAEVNVISFDEGSPENPTNYTTINFEAVGTWSEVFKTISLLDHVSAAISISDLEISRNRVSESKKGTVMLWSAMITVKVLKLHI